MKVSDSRETTCVADVSVSYPFERRDKHYIRVGTESPYIRWDGTPSDVLALEIESGRMVYFDGHTEVIRLGDTCYFG